MVGIRILKRILLRSNSNLAGRLAMLGFVHLDKKGIEVPGLLRVMLDTLQPVNPLRGSQDLPEIEILIPFVLKDIEMLKACAEGAVYSSSNTVSMVRLITPYRTKQRAPKELENATLEVRNFLREHGIPLSVEFDEDVVPESVRNHITSLALAPRYHGWLSAQTVKVFGAMGAKSRATLIVDSDTVLTFPRVWVDGLGRQVLMIGQESRPSFFTYASEYLNIRARPRLSYITHHQMMQADILEEIFPRPDVDIIRWIHDAGLTGPDHDSGELRVAEYEIYGAYLDTRRPKRRVYASWGNGTGVRDADLSSTLRTLIGGWALSTSFHHYKSRSNTPDEVM